MYDYTLIFVMGLCLGFLLGFAIGNDFWDLFRRRNDDD
jgi:hypothetical protein